jgi:hypothetical protein
MTEIYRTKPVQVPKKFMVGGIERAYAWVDKQGENYLVFGNFDPMTTHEAIEFSLDNGPTARPFGTNRKEALKYAERLIRNINDWCTKRFD